ncbi:MAG: hypothetical protein ACLS9K_05660 [Lachnospira eligens]
MKEFLYNSPELQHIFMIPKEEIEKGRFTICCGIAVKEEHVEKYSLKTNDYASIIQPSHLLWEFQEFLQN